jgi:hypothetical protein
MTRINLRHSRHWRLKTLSGLGNTQRANPFMKICSFDAEDTRGPGDIPVGLLQSFKDGLALSGIARFVQM